MKTEWHSTENSYDIVVRDDHGHHFNAAWVSKNDSPERISQVIVDLLYMSTWRRDGSIDYDGNFVEYFSGGYNGEERRWRAREATRIKGAAHGFNRTELIKAAGSAARRRDYDQDRGPKDWSPIREVRG